MRRNNEAISRRRFLKDLAYTGGSLAILGGMIYGSFWWEGKKEKEQREYLEKCPWEQKRVVDIYKIDRDGVYHGSIYGYWREHFSDRVGYGVFIDAIIERNKKLLTEIAKKHGTGLNDNVFSHLDLGDELLLPEPIDNIHEHKYNKD